MNKEEVLLKHTVAKKIGTDGFVRLVDYMGDDAAIVQAARVADAIAVSGLPTEISSLELTCDGGKLVDHMRHDKKMDAGTLPFILLRSIGAAFLDHEVSLDDIAIFMDEQLKGN